MNQMGRILFMDDDKIFTTVMSKMLSNLGYSVDIANEGKAAVDLYTKEMTSTSPYRAVILDLYVAEGIGGVETIERLLAIDPNVRAIVSTGSVNDTVMKGFKSYGFQGVLPKPYDIKELDDTLKNVIRAD